jgi:mRNA-degrading endonuclease RelE of RelBE toxin-antitoxin system
VSFHIETSSDALAHLQTLSKYDQIKVLDGIELHLTHNPMTPTRNRKQMRSNLISTWELRIGGFRVYYDVEDENQKVLIRAIGIKKHNRLFIGGIEIELR